MPSTYMPRDLFDQGEDALWSQEADTMIAQASESVAWEQQAGEMLRGAGEALGSIFNPKPAPAPMMAPADRQDRVSNYRPQESTLPTADELFRTIAPEWAEPEPVVQEPVRPGISSPGQQTAGAGAVPPPQAPAVERGGDLRAYARQAAQRAGVDPDIFERQIQQENGFKVTGGSSAGAQGIAQIVPKFHPGVDVNDPYASLDYAANLMKSHLGTYGGDYEKSLAAYNAGPGNVASGAYKGFAETQTYLKNILGGAGEAVGKAVQGAGQAIGQLTQDPAKNDILGSARQELGKPYGGPLGGDPNVDRWGQVGWDCSSFVSGVFKRFGVNLTPFTDRIAAETRQIDAQNARPGDIVMFSYADSSQPGVEYPHTAIYAGDGKIIDASYGRGVTERPMPTGLGTPEFHRPDGVTGADSRGVAATADVVNEATPNIPDKGSGLPGKQAANPWDLGKVGETLGRTWDAAGETVRGAVSAVGETIGEASQSVVSGLNRASEGLTSGLNQGSETSTGALNTSAENPEQTFGPGGTVAQTWRQHAPIAQTLDLERQILEAEAAGDGQTAAQLRAKQDEILGNMAISGTEPMRGLGAADDAARALARAAGESPNLLSKDAESTWVQHLEGQRRGREAAAAGRSQGVGSVGGELPTERPAIYGPRGEILSPSVVREVPSPGPTSTGGRPPRDPPLSAGDAPPPNPNAAPMGTLYRNLPRETPALGERVGAMRREMVRKWTDRQVDVNEFQKDAQRHLGRPLNADEMVSELNRLNPNQAALTRLQETLRPALTDLGRQDLPWLSEYLTYRHNVDVAVEKGAARRFSFGLSAQESQARLGKMAEELGPERMAKIEQSTGAVKELVDSYRQRMVDSGIWDQRTHDLLKKAYPNYLPTKIVDYLTEASERLPAGKKISLSDRQLKRLSEEGTDKVREDPLASLVRYAYDSETMIRKNDTVNALVNLAQEGAPGVLRRVPDNYGPKAGETSLFRWVNGNKEKYVAPKELAAVINQEASNTSVPVISGLATLFREMITRSPVFVAGQVPLDAYTYMVRTTGLEGGPQAVPKVIAALGGAYWDAFKGLRQGEFKGDLAIFMREGGGMAGFQQRATDAYRQNVDNLARSSMFEIKSAGDLASTARWLGSFEWSQAVGQRVEMAPRLAAFRMADRRGESLAQSVVRGRDVTIDFARGGTLAKSINSAVPFFNVGIQASTTLGRMVRENPKGAALSLAGLVSVPTIASEVWNRQNPEMEQDYADVPDYVKDRGLVWMIPGSAETDKQGNRKPNYFLLPMRELAPVAIMTREALNKAMGRESSVDGWRALGAAMGAASPIQGSNAGDLFNSVNPIGASTGLQLATNRDFFRDRDIATERADEEASELSKGLAERLGVRPAQVEFAIRDLTGHLGGAGLAASDMAAGRDRGETGIQAMPLVGGLAKRFAGNSIGGGLETARDERVSEGVAELLRDAGFRPDEIVTPVGLAVKGVPLTKDQQESWQELTNTYVERELRRTGRTPEYRAPRADKEKLLRDAVSRAKEQAADRILSRIPSSRQDRLRRQSG